MRLQDVMPLSPDSIEMWEDVTQEHIKDQIQLDIGLANIETIEVEVVYKTQMPPYVGRGPTPAPTTAAAARTGFVRRNDRNMQVLVDTADDSLALDFDVILSIRSRETDYDLNRYVYNAFDTTDDQVRYINMLLSQGGDDSASEMFEPVSGVEVMTEDGPPSPPPSNASTDAVNAGLIAGITIAGVAILGVAGYLGYNQYSKSKGGSFRPGKQVPDSDDNNAKNGSTPLANLEVKETNDYASEIDVDSRYEISTLGDPLPHHMHEQESLGTREDSFSLQGMDYDYTKAYGASGSTSTPGEVQSSSAGTSTGMQIPGDDDTFGEQYVPSASEEKRFDVEAPPGMLGLVLETSADGVPTVHAVKASSALAETVKIGDRLLTVDGEDVTVMLASEVSRLIAVKRDNSARHMTFARRPRGGGTPRLDSNESLPSQ